MAETKEQPFIESLEAVMAQHRADVEEEGKKDKIAYDTIREGRAWIETYDQANSAAKLIAEAEAALGRTKALMDAKIRRAQARVNRLKYLFENPLKQWTQTQLMGKKRRSIVLDDAEVALRKVSGHAVTESELTLIAWAERSLVDAITYVPRISIEIVSQWERANGKLAPGRIERPEEEHFKVKIPKGKDEADGEADGEEA